MLDPRGRFLRAASAGSTAARAPTRSGEAAGNSRSGKGCIPILVDSGFRRGTDVVKALCMGATAVCVGRPYTRGLGAFEQSGVERALELQRIETHAIMQQIGAPTIKHLVPGHGATASEQHFVPR